MKTKLFLAAVVAALTMMLPGLTSVASAQCAPGAANPDYCQTGPQVTTTDPTNVTETGATLNGTVRPNGFRVTYRFEYGLTTSYGTQTPAVELDSLSDQDSNVSAAITGLTPNTLYNYRITATYTPLDGGAPVVIVGGNKTFTTAPASAYYNQPPTVVTGPCSGITSTSVTVTGAINPNGAPSFSAFQYGTSAAFGQTTTAVPAGSGTTAVPTSATLTGLAPGTTYSYRFVGSNAAGTIAGATQTCTTTPAVTTPPPTNGKRKPRLTLSVKPKRDSSRPYRYRTRGKLKRRGVSRRRGCRGRVRITVTRKGKRVARKTVRIKRRNCRYSTRIKAKRRTQRTVRGRLRVRARFLGNTRLRKVNSRRVVVRYGPKR